MWVHISVVSHHYGGENHSGQRLLTTWGWRHEGCLKTSQHLSADVSPPLRAWVSLFPSFFPLRTEGHTFHFSFPPYWRPLTCHMFVISHYPPQDGFNHLILLVSCQSFCPEASHSHSASVHGAGGCLASRDSKMKRFVLMSG